MNASATADLIQMSPELAVGVVALVVGLVRILEVVLRWGLGKMKKEQAAHGPVKPLVVQLDAEVSKIIHDTDQNVRDMHMVMGRVDQDGTPMVYSSRSGIDTLREIAAMVKETARSQERLAATLDRLDGRFEDHDREERITHAKMQDALAAVHEDVKK
jgi:hypothetical protein